MSLLVFQMAQISVGKVIQPLAINVCQSTENEGGIFKQLNKALIERCLNAQLHAYLNEECQDPEKPPSRNSLNGHSKKTIKGELGEVDSAVPRDWLSKFEPILIPKGQTRCNGFDDNIISLYA